MGKIWYTVDGPENLYRDKADCCAFSISQPNIVVGKRPQPSAVFLWFSGPRRAHRLGIFALLDKGGLKMSKLREALVDARLLGVLAEAGLDVSSVDFGARSAEEWRVFLAETVQGLEGVRLLVVVTVALGLALTPDSVVM